MRADQFSTTYLGRHWFNIISLLKPEEGILEKGKVMAEKEIITDMQFLKGSIEAKIEDSGEIFTPVLKFTSFSQKMKTDLIQIIRGQINKLPDLYFRILPEDFYNELLKKKIHLVPSSIKQIRFGCSCGNKRVCEHVVNLIFSSSTEIEKNPSLLFMLRNFELRHVFRDKNSDTGIIKYDRLSESFISHDEIFVDRIPETANLNLSSIDPVNILSIFKLLPEKPLFYTREDFRKLLLEKYKTVATYSAEYPVSGNYRSGSLKGIDFYLIYSAPEDNKELNSSDTSNQRSLVPSFYTTRYMQNFKTTGEEEVTIPVIQGEKLSLQNVKLKRAAFQEVLDYFLSIPFDISLKNNSASSRFLNASSSFALLLLQNYAYVPELRFINEEDFFVSYCPLTTNTAIERSLELLKELVPPNIVIRKNDAAVYRSNVHIHILQLFMTHIIHMYETKFGRRHFFADRKIYNSFFKGEVFHPLKYNEMQNGIQAALWLEKLSYINLDPSPLIVFSDISENQYEFTLQIRYKSGRTSDLSELFRESKENNRSSSALRHRIIRQLNSASDYFPELADVLNNEGNTPIRISAIGMNNFIKKTESIIQLLGIESDIPVEMRTRNIPQAILTARLKNFSGLGSQFDVRGMIDFEWSIRIGDDIIPVDEYLKLASKNEGIVNINGNYFINDPSDTEIILRETAEKTPKLNPPALLRILLSGEYNNKKIQTDTKIEKLLESLFSIDQTSIPGELNAELKDYQVRGFHWLYSKLKKGLGLCLADDMGLGKTVQVIAVMLKLRKEKLTRLPVLIICPTSLVANWYKELEKFAPSLRVFVYHGTRRRFELNKQDVILTTYGIIRNEAEKFRKYDWNLIILDEAQNIKNWESEQAKTVKSLASEWHLAMTGTPVENRLTELWSIFDFINHDFLGSYHHFRSNYAIPIEKYGDTERLTKLRQITSPFILRRLKSDPDIIRDLPDKIELDEFCYLTNEQAMLYRNTINEVFGKIANSSKSQRSAFILNLITYLKQICNHPALFTKEKNIDYRLSGKTEKMMDLIAGFLDRDEKCLIFTQYKEMGKLLCIMLKYEFNMKPLFFHGGLSIKKREDNINRFQSSEEDKIMIISIKAGGTGINLTAAERVIHFDLWWNPAVENQATDRTYRIGQDKNVTIHRLITADTFEEKIDKLLKNKKELADLAIISGDPGLMDLSNRELKQLFKLEK